MVNLNIDSIKKRTYDAIVIGSGMSGGWAAKELTGNGLRTLVLERGRDVKHIHDYPTAMKKPWAFEHRGQVGSSVNILLESHGKVVYSDMLLKIMKAAEHPNVGLIWDFFNMWSVTKESPKFVYEKLKKYIKHAHVKDAKLVNDKETYTLIGEGEAPLTEALMALRKGGYKGYYSFEWEKMWHPEIQEPEIALPHYAKAIQKYL